MDPQRYGIYMRCMYGIFGREITEYTVMHGVYIYGLANPDNAHSRPHLCSHGRVAYCRQWIRRVDKNQIITPYMCTIYVRRIWFWPALRI